MYWLRLAVYERTYLADRSVLFSALVTALRQLNLKIEAEDQESGVIVVHCLTMAANWILWRCWSDKLLFELKGTGEKTTQLIAYAIPSLFRTSVRRSESVTSVSAILAKVPL